MTPEISPAPTTNSEIERHQSIAATMQISTNTATVLSPETDTTEIAQSPANRTFVTIVILVLALHFHSTIVREMTLTPIDNRRRINPAATNLVHLLFIDMTLELLIAVVQTLTAIELLLKTANLTLETMIIIIAVMSPCLRILPSRHQFLPKTSMSAIDAPLFKFKLETGMVQYSSIPDQQPLSSPLHSSLKLEQSPSHVSTTKPNQSSAPSNLMPSPTCKQRRHPEPFQFQRYYRL